MSSPFVRPLPNFPLFVSGDRFLNDPSLFDMQERLVRSAIGNNPHALFDGDSIYDTFVWCLGRGSGKTYLQSRITAYYVYVLASLRSIPDFLGVDVVDIAVVSNRWNNETQERMLENLFSHYTFQDMQIKKAPHGFTINGNIRIYFFSGDAYEGYNPLLWFIIEPYGIANNKDGVLMPQMVNVLRSSAQSRYPGKHKGFVIGSPQQENDFMMNPRSVLPKVRHLAHTILPTWEVRDDRTKDDFKSFLGYGNPLAMGFTCNME